MPVWFTGAFDPEQILPVCVEILNSVGEAADKDTIVAISRYFDWPDGDLESSEFIAAGLI